MDAGTGQAGAEGAGVSEAPPPDRAAPEEDHPRGAFFLAIVFLVMVALLWLWTYAVLLDRA